RPADGRRRDMLNATTKAEAGTLVLAISKLGCGLLCGALAATMRCWLLCGALAAAMPVTAAAVVPVAAAAAAAEAPLAPVATPAVAAPTATARSRAAPGAT